MPEYRLSLDFTAADDAQAARLAEAWAGTCEAEYGTRFAGVERLTRDVTAEVLARHARDPRGPVVTGAYRLVREWRIGWSQGALMRAVHTLDRIDPGWQQRPSTLRMLGLVTPGKCDATAVVFADQRLFCGLTHGHEGRHHDDVTEADWSGGPIAVPRAADGTHHPEAVCTWDACPTCASGSYETDQDVTPARRCDGASGGATGVAPAGTTTGHNVKEQP